MRTNPTSPVDFAEYKFYYNIFDEGDIEQLVGLLDDFNIIREHKPLERGESQFAYFVTMLDGDAKARWQSNVENSPSASQRMTTAKKFRHPVRPLKHSPS